MLNECKTVEADDGFRSCLLGVHGKFMDSAQSAFHAEVAALEISTEITLGVMHVITQSFNEIS